MSGTEQEYGPSSIDETEHRLLFEERRAANGKKCAGVKWKPSEFRFWESRGEALPYVRSGKDEVSLTLGAGKC